MTALRLRKNSAFNLAGGVIPAVAALAALPFIVADLGAEGYGLLVLVTSILGYFALLDVNVTASSTKFVAEHHARGDKSRVNQTLSFGLVIYVGIGLIGGVLLFTLARWLATDVFRIQAEQLETAVACLQIAAFGFFFGQLQMYLQSVPQALMRFDITAYNEMFFGLAIPLGTVLLLMGGLGLVHIVLLRVLMSVVNALVLAIQVRRIIPGLRWLRPDAETIRGMSSFSAYSFLSRVAALSYAHGDKLIIGAVVGMKPLAIYAVAATVGNRVLGLMFRVSAVLFPAASALAARGDENRLRTVYLKLTRYVVYVNLSALLLLGVFAEPLLRHWVGEEYSVGGALVLQLVALGQFVDSLTNLPSLVNDGRGFPKNTGLFAIARAVVGLAAVYLLVLQFGIVGAAAGHLLSGLLVSTAFIAFVHGRTVPVPIGDVLRRAWAAPMLGAAGIALCAALAFTNSGGGLRAVVGIAACAVVALAAYGWFVVLLSADRQVATQWLCARWQRAG